MQTEVFVRHPVLRGYWYAVARSSDVAPGPLALTVLGERLVLWRTEDGASTAARDRCPHREAPLSLGQVVEHGLQCPYHGWTFGASGACVRIPSAPHTCLRQLDIPYACAGYSLALRSYFPRNSTPPLLAGQGGVRARGEYREGL